MSRRNPNHYGCVTRLSGKRSRPWMVKVTTYDQEGNGRQTPIGYAATKEEAMIILAEYNKNPWKVDREKITFNFNQLKMLIFRISVCDLVKPCKILSISNKLETITVWPDTWMIHSRSDHSAAGSDTSRFHLPWSNNHSI